jgi:2-oxoglutarate ferredoxin oxidoreductase subunit alpha
MTPVILLSDGFIANGAEPWKLPRIDNLPPIPVRFREDPEGFLPYLRDAATLARPWAIPGTPGLEHRVGGLEKADGTGNVSYDAANHETMVRIRAEKVARVANDIPDAVPAGDAEGGLLVVAWGSTYGAITGAVRRARSEGRRVSHLHLRHLHPMPRNTEAVLARFDRILVPEMNLGQLAFLLQGRFVRSVEPLTKVQGQPFKESEILDKIRELTEVH